MTESEICKKIYQLLTACGAESETYKKLFLRDVLKLSNSDEEFDTLQIYQNYFIDEQEIDLAFETARRLIPLKVKIDGRDSPAQCSEILKVVKNYTDKEISAQIYYLTPFKKISSNEIIALTFGEEILTWLKNCAAQTQTELFRTVINSFTAEIESVVKAAEDFDAETRELYEFLMLELFEALDTRLDENFCAKFQLSKIPPNFRAGIENYYSSICTATPEIIFRYNGVNWKRRGYEILFCAGLDDGGTNCLCGSWYLFDTKLKQRCKVIPTKILAEVKNLFKIKLKTNSGTFIKKFLPASKNFNFTKKNIDVDSLFDDKIFSKTINSIVSAVEDLASNIGTKD